MATQTGSIDLKAQKQAHDDAEKKATLYLTNILDGVSIHPDGDDANKVIITSDGMEFFKNNDSVAFYGETVRVGEEESSHIEIQGTSIAGISSSGNTFFEVNENGGATPATYWAVLSGGRTADDKTYNLKTLYYDTWMSISENETFYIKVYHWSHKTIESTGKTYYYTLTSSTVPLVKGTRKTTSSVYYDGTNSVTISNSTHYDGHTEDFGYNDTIDGALYKFGRDVAETGGANGFMMGEGTVADGENQLAIGKYNESDNSSYLVIGNGSSDSARSTVFKISRNGTIYPQNTEMADFVVELSADGIWQYRKWHSGVAECWTSVYGPWTVAFTQMASGTFSNETWTTKVEALPTDLFTSITYGNVAAITNGYTSTQVCGLSTSEIRFRLWNSYAVTAMNIYSYQLYVKGRWR